MDIMCASRLCVKASAEYSITFNLVIPENIWHSMQQNISSDLLAYSCPGVMALRFLNLSKGTLLLSVHLTKFYHETYNKSMQKGFCV